MQETTLQTVTSQERNWAMLAHGSVLITFIVSVVTSGMGVLIPVLVPFFIWLAYRDRSPYVAFHALQATLYQLAAIALITALGIGLAVALFVIWAVVVVLSFFVVGIVLIPVAAILTAVVGVILAILPLVGLGYGLIAAWEVYNRTEFRYQWIADWLEDRLAGQTT